ncbi:MAG: DUF2339 domain-containing protein [candidate division Zixibacteria bacterium]|nr:DUF2339 domain-containing protein [candidate division Zixibacteria bacterium]
MSETTDDRLRRIEERLDAIEKRLGVTEKLQPTPLPEGRVSAEPAPDRRVPPRGKYPAPSTPSFDLPVTAILGWGGVAALVLAAIYLVQLAIDSGFLTPVRQVGLATILGVGMIALGFILREEYRRISALLPAGGVVVLFVTVYGAHLYHGLIGATAAVAGVIVICLVSLALREAFERDYYTFFAVIGAYSGPYFLHILAARPLDLIIYFGAWDFLFCIYALRARRRSVYVLAGYLAFVVFDASWRQAEYADWMWAAAFQAIQFLIFLSATVFFTIRHRRPLSNAAALVHLPAIVFFYTTTYVLVNQHASAIAPWLAFASVVPMVLGYLIARRRLPGEALAGELIVTTYAAMVLFHAGYIELVNTGWRELTSLVGLMAVSGLALSYRHLLRRFWPLTLAVAVAAFISYSRLAAGIELDEIVAWRFLIPLYVALGYMVYWFMRRASATGLYCAAVLYGTHLLVMAGIVHMSDSRLIVSVVWGLLAVLALVISIVNSDRPLGRSSLIVFTAFAAKVLLFDLSGASPLVRIGCLLVLGVTMYLGGMLYQNIDPDETPESIPEAP